jgi:hypothetical protein
MNHHQFLKGKRLALAGLFCLLLILIIPGVSLAEVTLSFSDLNGLQENQIYQIYSANSTTASWDLLGEYNSSDLKNHTATLSDGSYIIVNRPDAANVYFTNPFKSLEWAIAFIPVLVALLPYFVVAIGALGILFVLVRQGKI